MLNIDVVTSPKVRNHDPGRLYLMHRVLSHFRPTKIRYTINAFLRPHPSKSVIQRKLKNGLLGD